jgi:hypothetical protein
MSWWMTLAALGILAVSAFLVSWLLTDVLRLPRAVYLAGLMVVTGALTIGYLTWSGTDAVAFVTHNWAWGLVGAIVSGGFLARAVDVGANRSGLPRPSRRGIARMSGLLVWEGLFYGAAEGLLLSALPVLAAWQTFHLLGWTDTTAGAIGSGVLAILASVVVIFVHHLGYREFRGNRQGIVMAIFGCGVLSIAYLLTASPIAPVGGHVLLHTGLEVRGVEMPPYAKPLTMAPGTGERHLQAAA